MQETEKMLENQHFPFFPTMLSTLSETSHNFNNI